MKAVPFTDRSGASDPRSYKIDSYPTYSVVVLLGGVTVVDHRSDQRTTSTGPHEVISELS